MGSAASCARSFQRPAADPMVIALATLGFALCGALAIALPARSAARSIRLDLKDELASLQAIPSSQLPNQAM